VVVLGVLFYRYLVHDGDFDVYWTARFRFLHGLKVHIYEQNVFTYPTFASFLLLPVYPLGYSTGKILFFAVNVLILVGAVRICQREILLEMPARIAITTISVPQDHFRAEMRNQDLWGYLREHYAVALSVSPDGVRWLQARGSKGNQLLYRILASHLGQAIPSNFVFLGLCAFFALLLFEATRRCKDSIFVLGLLFYTAFVLIGPQSSKPHFIAFFGLLLFCWQDALLNRSWLKEVCLVLLSSLLGVKAVAGRLPAGPLARDIVGLAGFALRLYSYVLLLISGHCNPLSSTKT
jgi:hypothetical protein